MAMNDLRLEEFLPYRLSVLANRVSKHLARAYRNRFGMSVPEWRVMAIIGTTDDKTALDIVEASVMDKVAVSRAVAGLAARGLLVSRLDSKDRRRHLLSLTSEGLSVYHEVVPLARRYHMELLEQLGTTDAGELDRLLHVLDRVAETIGEGKWIQGDGPSHDGQ